MPLADDPPHGHFATEYDRLRHESITSLTTISGRAQLMRRRVLRSSGLTELEREWMLDGLATIEAAARDLALLCHDRRLEGSEDRARIEAFEAPETRRRDR